VSALEEYNRFMDGVFDGPDGRCAWIPGRNYIMPNGPIPVARYHEVVTKADAAIAELEAENVRQKATIEAQSAIIKQADEALAARERMLRLAWTETVQAESYYWKYHDNVDEWLADLRARAEEGSE